MSPEDQTLLKNIGIVFHNARVDANMTQREAASATGSTQANVSYLERGVRDVQVLNLRRWADAYGLDLEINLIPKRDVFMDALYEAMDDIQEVE